MKSFLFTLFVIAALVVCANCTQELPVEQGVLVLTKGNFDEAIDRLEHVLVDFYAPWCGQCKALGPEFAKAAQHLAAQGSTVKLAKVDATVETELAEKYHVDQYPKLTFFRNKLAVEYGGGRLAAEIVAWVEKACNPPAILLRTVPDAEKFVKKNDVTVIGFFLNPYSDKASAFIIAANASTTSAFGITSSEDVMGKYSASDGSIVLLKSFGANQAEFTDELTTSNLKKFIQLQTLPLIIEFNHQLSDRIFDGPMQVYLIFFVSKDAGHIETYVEPLTVVAKLYREDILFMVVSSDEVDYSGVYSFFGMARSQVPAMRIVDMQTKLLKYAPEINDMSVGYVTKYIEDYLKGHLKHHLDMPADWDRAMVDLVISANREDGTFETNLKVLIDLYLQWCQPCNDLASIYYHLGEKFKTIETVSKTLKEMANQLEHTEHAMYTMNANLDAVRPSGCQAQRGKSMENSEKQVKKKNPKTLQVIRGEF